MLQWFVEQLEFTKVKIFEIKIDIDKLKYEKWSKYRFKQPKCIVLGTPKSQKSAKNELTHSKN